MFGCLSLVLPTAADLGPVWLIILRVCQGLGEALTFPCFNHLMGNWVPKEERSVFSSFAIVGASLGMVISQPVTGYLCTFQLLDGWPLREHFFHSLDFFERRGCLNVSVSARNETICNTRTLVTEPGI